MSPIESIFYMLWRGFAIGVMISAPMGPVGILCIQRTLDKGRKAGFYTGIGAAISDLFYCLLTGFGLSFIEDFLQDNQDVIQLLGSIVLIAFSIYLFKKNPSSTLRRPVPQNVSAKKNILGGFLFTFSNPLIIFLIIGLFARFNFTSPEIKGGFYAVGYLFIVIGALCWWYGVTHLIERVRTKFNMRSMKKMNVAIGIVILAFACVGIVTSILGLTSAQAKASRFLPAIDLIPSESIVPSSDYVNHRNSGPAETDHILFSASGDDPKSIDRDILPDDCRLDSIVNFRLDFKLRNISSHPMKRYPFIDEYGVSQSVSSPAWGIVITDSSGEETVLRFYPGESDGDPVSSRRTLFCKASLRGGLCAISQFDHETFPTYDTNHFRIEYDNLDRITVRAGAHKLGRPTTFINRAPGNSTNGNTQKVITGISLRLWPGSEVEIGRATLSLSPDPAARLTSFTDDEISYRLIHSSDPTEGKWRRLDYSLEESLIKSGGEYEVFIMHRPDGIYEIIYGSGAVVNGECWKPGMLKGLLKPTGQEGIYSVEWRDAMGQTIDTEIKAQLENPDLLTIHFPRQSSTLRFSRLQ